MLKFKFEVRDDFFPQVFKGEIEAKNKADALNQITEIYASELGTVAEALKVTLV